MPRFCFVIVPLFFPKDRELHNYTLSLDIFYLGVINHFLRLLSLDVLLMLYLAVVKMHMS